MYVCMSSLVVIVLGNVGLETMSIKGLEFVLEITHFAQIQSIAHGTQYSLLGRIVSVNASMEDRVL